MSSVVLRTFPGPLFDILPQLAGLGQSSLKGKKTQGVISVAGRLARVCQCWP